MKLSLQSNGMPERSNMLAEIIIFNLLTRKFSNNSQIINYWSNDLDWYVTIISKNLMVTLLQDIRKSYNWLGWSISALILWTIKCICKM